MFPFDIFEKCEFVTLDEESSKLPFVCGDDDLEDFFTMMRFYTQKSVLVKHIVL